ncbi:hypothetical protein MT340_009290 [Staphylococcus sp. NRL 16/872]|uniref:hypothetical protein n=1 Tax=Staphylococcus sp. NRL 16/872 TaxID=2930131 RepID=UPI001FB32177|nr:MULTISPECIES: hypothetical protein [unclassified Staphylococcus]MCJ1656733.1 hypothetical protein [Staphylococcus sp. NRL 21/187]MCJ1662485.1 hypothetical protein [Staphylococcus sp. NRL 18/288]MCJ1668579.1 hypothetical protein [Staphylococcus sp. NRL 19/737]WEN68795.1 hypothetical protein MT340_009290 [Staphylococcus sp. NRL 16/872]
MDPSVRFDVEPPKNTTWNWKGHIHFTTRMKVRKTLSLTGTELDSKHWFNVGDYTDFDQIKKVDGYWWCRFKFDNKGDYFWVALCRIHDKEQRIKVETKEVYGKISWY